MAVSLIQKKEVNSSSIKDIKEKVKDQKYKTYSLKHNLLDNKYPGVILNRFFWDYNEVLNNVIKDICGITAKAVDTIEWKEYVIDKNSDIPYYSYNQKRLYPSYRKDGEFKKEIRDHYLKNWIYNTHWINSAIDTAFSILDSCINS